MLIPFGYGMSNTRNAGKDCGGGPGTKTAGGSVKTTMNAPFGKRVSKRGGGKR